MIKKTIGGFIGNMIEKPKNPFWGTYVLVCLIRNWKLVYSLFNMNPKIPLDSKILIIEKYFKLDYTLFVNILINVGWTFVILFFSYAFTNITTLIKNMYQNRLYPFILKISDYKSLVPIELYNKLDNEKDFFKEKLDEEREKRMKIEEEHIKFEDEKQKLKSNHRAELEKFAKVVEGAKEYQDRNALISKIFKRKYEVYFEGVRSDMIRYFRDKKVLHNFIDKNRRLNKSVKNIGITEQRLMLNEKPYEYINNELQVVNSFDTVDREVVFDSKFKEVIESYLLSSYTEFLKYSSRNKHLVN